MNNNEKIQGLLKTLETRRILGEPGLPKIVYRSGKPTKKFLKWNRKMIQKGITTFYADPEKYYDVKKGKILKIYFDKRYKTKKVLRKKQKYLTGKIDNSSFNEALENTTIDTYKTTLINNFNSVGENAGVFEVDTRKINFQDLIKLIALYAGERQILGSVKGTPEIITFSGSNLNRFNRELSFNIEDWTGRSGSDTQFLFELAKEPIIILKFAPIKKDEEEKPNGGFFKYYHKLDLDLTRYDIYKERQQEYKNNCLYIALSNSGLEQEKLNDFLVFVKNAYVPTCYLTKICNKLNIHIILRRIENSKTLHFGNKELEPIKIGLMNKHFFLIEEVKITRYAINNYEDIKTLNKWNEIYTKEKTKYKRKKRFIDSFQVVKLLLKNKDKLLVDMPIEDILDTQYHSNKVENNNLEYDEKICCEENKTSKMDNTESHIIYYDFETNTTGDKHVPYLMCSIDEDGVKNVFIGSNCGYNFINYLKSFGGKKDSIMLVAHNARYDYTFIMDFLYCATPLLKGNRLMGGSARVYYSKSSFVEVRFQDSLNLVPTRLSAFSEMFNIKVKKEILPYSLYTTENIKKKFVPINECIKEVKYQYEYQKGCKEQEVKETITEYIKNAHLWGCIHEDTINIIEYSKIYCLMDCEVLKKGYETFREWIKEITELDTVNYCSIASLSLDYLIKEECFKDCFKLCGRPRDFIQQFVVGGRVMTAKNEKFKVEGIINDFDAVSLYPSAMARMKGLLKGKPKLIKEENLNINWLNNNTDGYFIKCLAITDCKIKRDITVLSSLNDKGVRDWTNETAGKIFYLDKVGYEDAINFQKIDFKIICGYYYNEGHNDNIKKSIIHLFNARLKAKAEITTKNKVFKFSLKQIKNKENKKIQEQLKKDKIEFEIGNPIQAIYKLLMNSCYGKCLLKPIDTDLDIVSDTKWKKYLAYNYNFIKSAIKLNKGYVVKKIKTINQHFNNCYAGVEILSMSKRIMNELICLGQDNNCKIYYTDTDSIHIEDSDIKKLEKLYLQKYKKVLVGKNMGQFHSDFELKGATKNIYSTKLIALGKKCYLDMLRGEDDDGNIIYGTHIRMKAISPIAINDHAIINKTTIENIYEDLLLGEKKQFDLLARGKCCKFRYNPDMTISSSSSFLRSVSF
tara:strand:- start:836 stop:4249 length:3414 start_codon:yes stop_codon:yes gene_type:complete